MNSNKSNRILIIGGGLAGISCAIQLKREGFEPMVFEKGSIGGLIKNASLIENFCGLDKNISGEEFASRLERQAKDNEINIVFEEIQNVEFLKNIYCLKTQKNEYKTDFLVVATGTVPKEINLNTDREIFYEIKDLKKPSGKTITIIGAGDAAFDYALNLVKNNQVVILNRSTDIKALKILQDRVFLSNIKYIENFDMKDISTIKPDYILAATGREANDSLIRNLPKSDFLYIIGDVKNGEFRQLSISMADGIRAAMEISKKCKSLQKQAEKI